MCVLMSRGTPFVFAIALYLLWQEIGVAAIFGIAYMFLVLPLGVTAISRKFSKNDVRNCTGTLHVVRAPISYTKNMWMYVQSRSNIFESYISIIILFS